DSSVTGTPASSGSIPLRPGEEGLTAFLTYLARRRRVAAATQNQALNALVFLYQQVLGVELAGFAAERAKRSAHVPVVLSRDETMRGLRAAGDVARIVRFNRRHGGLRSPHVRFSRSHDRCRGG